MENIYKGQKIFRAKRKDNSQEVEGAYLEHINRQICPIGDSLKPEDITHYIIFGGFADWNMPIPVQMVEVIPETVVQFIGKLDKNGKRIFEGDLVHWKSTAYSSKVPYKVIWWPEECRYILVTPNDKVPIIESMELEIVKDAN